MADNKGMQAQNWRKADTKRIMSEKLKSKKDNIKLFDAIKNVVATAVDEIRGDNTDDKYRYIVDLIMMRVRSALKSIVVSNIESLFTDIVDSVIDIVNSDEYLNKVSDYTLNYLQENSNSLIGSLTGSDNILGQITDNILDIIEKNNTENSLEQKDNVDKSNDKNTDDESVKTKDLSENNEDTNNKQEVKNEDKNEEQKDNKISNKDVITIANKLNDNIEKLQELINKNIDSINIKNINKNVSTVTQTKKTKTTKKGVLTNKQFKQFLNAINSKFTQINFTIGKLGMKLHDLLSSTDDKLYKIYKIVKESQSKGVMKWLLLIGLIAIFVIPKVFDKISELFSKLFGSINLTMIFTKIINAIPFKDLITKSINTLIEVLIEKFKEFISNPMDILINRLKYIWKVLTEFATDIWNWVTGKTKEAEKQQAENEQQAEINTAEVVNKSLGNFSNVMNNAVNNMTDKTNKQLDKQNAAINSTTNSVNDATKNLNNNINSNTNTINKNINEQTKNAQDASINSSKQLEATLNTSVNNLDKSCNDKIKNAEKKAQAEVDEKLKKEGPPIKPTKDDIKKFESSSPDKSKIDTPVTNKPKQPASITAVNNAQNKNEKLYVEKSQLDEVKKNSDEVNKLDESITPQPDINNNQTLNNETNQKIEQQLIINGPNGEKLDKITLEQKASNFKAVIDTLATIDTDIKTNDQSLNELKNNVATYFSTLNGCLKNIIDLSNKKDKDEHADTIIIPNNNNVSNDAGLEDI